MCDRDVSVVTVYARSVSVATILICRLPLCMHNTYVVSFVWTYIQDDWNVQKVVLSCAFGPSVTHNLITWFDYLSHETYARLGGMDNKMF